MVPLLSESERPAAAESLEVGAADPVTSRESDAFRTDLERRGFSGVGSTIIDAHMQAVGMVNVHLVQCFRYREVQRLR